MQGQGIVGSFDPKHHRRQSIRLTGYGYAQPGVYFVAICTYRREFLFEDLVRRHAAETRWQRIPRHIPHVQLDTWVVMPNHIHGILAFTGDRRRGEASPASGSHAKLDTAGAANPIDETASGDASPLLQRTGGVSPGSLGAVVGNFQSVMARRINCLRRAPGMPIWQSNYYEDVLRNEWALDAIRRYNAGNRVRWAWDRQESGGGQED